MKNTKIRDALLKYSIIGSSLFTIPLFASAATSPGVCDGYTGTLKTGATLKDVIDFFTCLIGRTLVPLIFAVALVVFLWGVIKFIQAQEASEREEGRQFMIWGIIALTVMISVWGLTTILGNTFHVTNVVPQLKVNGQ